MHQSPVPAMAVLYLTTLTDLYSVRKYLCSNLRIGAINRMFSHYSEPRKRFNYSLQNKYMSTRYFHLSSENQQTSLTLS
jgi:hypothetical protein